MKFTSFKIKETGKNSWGILNGAIGDDSAKIIDLQEKAPDLRSFLSDYQNGSGKGYENFSLDSLSEGTAQTWSLGEVELLACMPNPPSMRDGYAFKQHVEAARRNRGVPMIPEYYEFPIFYMTNHLAVTGPGPCLVRERHLEKLDFELEAAIVIGKECRNVSAADADEYIFGYTIMNDWSARTMQMEEMKLNLGPAKGKDFNTSLGPWLVTRDELADKRIVEDAKKGERFELEMTAVLNGKEISRGNMKDMTFTFAEIIERASYGCTLYPGDVIGSGTVGTGCFLELNGSKITDNQWLQLGDSITLEMDRLGKLTNTIEAEKL